MRFRKTPTPVPLAGIFPTQTTSELEVVVGDDLAGAARDSGKVSLAPREGRFQNLKPRTWGVR